MAEDPVADPDGGEPKGSPSTDVTDNQGSSPGLRAQTSTPSGESDNSADAAAKRAAAQAKATAALSAGQPTLEKSAKRGSAPQDSNRDTKESDKESVAKDGGPTTTDHDESATNGAGAATDGPSSAEAVAESSPNNDAPVTVEDVDDDSKNSSAHADNAGANGDADAGASSAATTAEEGNPEADNTAKTEPEPPEEVGPGRGMLDLMRYKKQKVDPILIPLMRKVLVAQPEEPLLFLHTVLGEMYFGEGEPDYASLREEKERLNEEVNSLKEQLSQTQSDLAAAQEQINKGGAQPHPSDDDDDYGGFDDDEFDEDPDSPKSGGSGGFSAQNQAATVLQKIGRAKLARAAAEKRKREKAEEERIAAEKQAELDRQNAASHVIYRAWRAVRLRRLASKFGDIVKAHKQMIEEEEARRAAQRAAEEARALAIVEKRRKERLVRSQTKKQIKEAELKAREEAAAKEAAEAKAQADAAAAAAAAAAEEAKIAKLKAAVHKSVSAIVISKAIPSNVPDDVRALLKNTNKVVLEIAQVHTQHVRGFEETKKEQWQEKLNQLKGIFEQLGKVDGAWDEVLDDAETRVDSLINIIQKTHLHADEEASNDTASMGNPDTGTEMTVKRTKTEAAKLKLLNPEGDITKSDTEFYGEMFGGGGGDDEEYDLEKRKEMEAKRAKAAEERKKAEAERKKQQKLLAARLESGVRVDFAKSMEQRAKNAVKQAEDARAAYAQAKKQEVTVMETIKAEVQQEEEGLNWLLGVNRPLTANLMKTMLAKVECPSQDVVLAVGMSGAWSSERGFIEDVQDFVLDYGSTQAAMENLDAAEVLEAGFAHERFWDVILGAVVAFVMEWQEAIFVISVGTSVQEIESEANGEASPKIKITDEFVNIVAEAVEIAGEEAQATGEHPPDALVILAGWGRSHSGENPVVPMEL